MPKFEPTKVVGYRFVIPDDVLPDDVVITDKITVLVLREKAHRQADLGCLPDEALAVKLWCDNDARKPPTTESLIGYRAYLKKMADGWGAWDNPAAVLVKRPIAARKKETE